jgi:DNA replication protein DnaC
VSLVSLFTKIKESFSHDNGYSQAEVVELLTKVDFLVLDDFADSVTMTGNVGSILNNILEVRAASKLPTVLVSPFPKSELVNKCDMRISGKLQSAKLISREGR